MRHDNDANTKLLRMIQNKEYFKKNLPEVVRGLGSRVSHRIMA